MNPNSYRSSGFILTTSGTRRPFIQCMASPPYPIQCMTTLHPLIQCKTASLIQCMSHPTHFIQCMRLSPIQCMTNLGLWRPDAWTKKIRFQHLIRNSLKTATFDYDFVDFWPEATHGSFGLFLGKSEETAPEALHYTMYGKLLHTMRDNKIPHTMENHTMYEAYNVCTIQCIKTLIHSVKVSNPRYIPKCQPKHVFGKKKLKKHTNIQRYIIQQSEKRLKKRYVDERVVVLLYGSRDVHENPGNLPEF